MHAKEIGRLQTRFFAHDSGVGCGSVHESLGHLRIKSAVAQAVRTVGWTPLIEETIGTQRADVLAIPPPGAEVLPVVWEVQLSEQTDSETARRTRAYRAAGADVVWLRPHRSASNRLAHPMLLLDGENHIVGPWLRLLHGACECGQMPCLRVRPRWQRVDARLPLEHAVAAVLSTHQWVRSTGWTNEWEAFQVLAGRYEQANCAAQVSSPPPLPESRMKLASPPFWSSPKMQSNVATPVLNAERLSQLLAGLPFEVDNPNPYNVARAARQRLETVGVSAKVSATDMRWPHSARTVSIGLLALVILDSTRRPVTTARADAIIDVAVFTIAGTDGLSSAIADALREISSRSVPSVEHIPHGEVIWERHAVTPLTRR